MFESKFKMSEKILNNWMDNSTKVTNLVNSQVPNQVKAIIGKNLDAAVAFSELSVVEPTYQPEEQTNTKRSKGSNKSMKMKGGRPIFKRSTVGFEAECSNMTEFDNQILKEVVDPSEPLQIGSSSLSSSQAEKPVTESEKKVKSIKRVKVSKKVSKSGQSEYNKTIEKLVESRLNEISKEVNFLKSLSKASFSKKSLTKTNTKLKTKKVVQSEPKIVAQAEKHIIKQQWVPKQIKPVAQKILVGELMCDLSSGEPISGWVPKLN